jgi:hypothetical protein
MSPADIAALNGNNDFGNSGWWLILLFLFAFNGGWGGNYGYNGNAAVGADIQRGFDQTALTNQIGALQNTLYSNQIADMNQSFANQQALAAQLGALQMSLQNCCCENRANIADLKYTIATENCADRAAVTQAAENILNKMCAQELEAEKRENNNLRAQINMLTLQASQVAQTAEIKSFLPTTTAGA